VRRAFHGGDIRSSIRQDRTDPDSKAGCSLASSITGADVRLLRQRYPGVPVVAYVNTSADVKAEVDICCTSERR
jgi:quinolinate synthase